MRLHDTLQSLLRRWYIVVLGVVLTVGLTWVVHERVPITYEAEGSLVLMPPAATVGIEGNPYMHLGGMAEARDVLIRRVAASETIDMIRDNYPDSNYRVVADNSTSGSIVLVSVVSKSPEQTLGLLEAALGKVPAALKEMQDELAIDERSRINLRGVVVDSEATADVQAQLRFMLVTAAAGFAGTLLLAATLDGFLLGRERMQPVHGQRAKRGTNSEVHGSGATEQAQLAGTILSGQVDVNSGGSRRPRSRTRTGIGSS